MFRGSIPKEESYIFPLNSGGAALTFSIDVKGGAALTFSIDVIDVNPTHGFWNARLMKVFGHEGKCT
jgi:hypothetical protein